MAKQNPKHIRELKKALGKIPEVDRINIEYTKRHIKLIMKMVNGNSRFVICPSTPGGANRSVENALAQAKNLIKEAS